MTRINLSEAVRRGFGSRHTLQRAIKQGVLEATKEDNGQIVLDLAQLEQVLGKVDTEHQASSAATGAEKTGKILSGLSDTTGRELVAKPVQGVQSCLLVLGMHRSGTSALTRCLNLLGVSLPKNLIGATPANTLGHWESVELNRTHDELLESNRSSWNDWIEFDQEWYASSQCIKYKEIITDIIRNDFADCPVFVVKDPRICRFVPFWRSVLDDLAIRFLPVLPFRNPLEVAHSLHARDGIEVSRACLIWLRHVLDAERDTRDIPRAFSRYEDLLKDPLGTTSSIAQRLDTSWSMPPASVEQGMRNFLDGTLRHSKFEAADLHDRPELGIWISRTYEALCALVDGHNVESAIETLDAVRAQLDEMEPVWRNIVTEAEQIARAPLALELDAARKHRDELFGEVGRLGAELTKRESDVVGLEANVSELSSAVERLSEDLNQSHAHATQIEAAKQQLEAEKAQLEAAREELASVNARLCEAIEALELQVTELAMEREKLEAVQKRLEPALRSERGRSSQLNDRLHASVSDNRQTRDQVRGLEERQQAMENSKSWRITKPLRRMEEFFHSHGAAKAKRAAADEIELNASVERYVPLADENPIDKTPVKMIAFYLPQYHPIPENDEWWGKGFTEWTNVASAQSTFAGHYQPHLPGELGFYDLRVPDVQARQIELAKTFGLGGFCFYFYWFAGKTLLEYPTRNYLNNKALDFPFCLCWANENWSRRWDGLDEDILIGQEHSTEDNLEFISHISEYFEDQRYIRIDGKPLLIVYRPGLFDNPKETTQQWRSWCRENGIGEIYLACTQSFESTPPEEFGFDAAIEFPPNNSNLASASRSGLGVPDDFDGHVLDWMALLQRSRDYTRPAYRLFRGICPSWDNTARKGNSGTILVNSTPKLFGEWAVNAIIDTCARFENPDERLVFVNAWNEWAEGCHLEPDRAYGYAWLQALKSALQAETLEKSRRIVVVSHDAHPHGAQYLTLNIARTLRYKFGYLIDVVLLGDGRLREAFEEVATVHELFKVDSEGDASVSLAHALFEGGAEAAICSTTVAGLFAEALKNAGFKVVSLVHELSGVIEGYGLQEHAKAIARSSDHVVFAAEMVAESFRGFAPIDTVKQVIRPQGVRRRIHQRSPADYVGAAGQFRQSINVPDQTRIVLAVGFADERKGFDLFVEAAEALAREQDDVVFFWVGHHEISLSERLSERTKKLQDQGKLILPGLTFETDLFYAGADIYLLTSREDPYPSTVLEALDAGLPVIGFERVTGTAGLIESLDGVLVPPFDVGALVGSIREVLATTDAAQKSSRAARFGALPEINMQGYVHDLLALADCAPKRISVIVPNYNYAQYLPERMKSILDQDHLIRELIVLDDASTDNSLDVIRDLLEAVDVPTSLIVNQDNSGSVFRQWLRGVEAAAGDYVWIAEADDLVEPEFLSEAMKGFNTGDVVLSYTQSKQMAENGAILCEDYLQYTHDVSPTQWLENYRRGGHDEIVNGLSVKNTIPNVSAVVFRRDALLQALRDHMDHISQFRVAGDWCLYVHLLMSGSCRFSARSLNLHRRHSQSVTISRFGQAELEEIRKMQNFVADEFDLDATLKQKSLDYRSELSAAFDV